METIHGPVAQLVEGDIIYQVTLASGMIVTNPSAFGQSEYPVIIPTAVVSEGGQILSGPRNLNNRETRL